MHKDELKLVSEKMTLPTDSKWTKAYVGPFDKEFAEQIAEDLRNCEVGFEAKIVERKGEKMYDVFIKY